LNTPKVKKKRSVLLIGYVKRRHLAIVEKRPSSESKGDSSFAMQPRSTNTQMREKSRILPVFEEIVSHPLEKRAGETRKSARKQSKALGGKTL